MAEAQANTRLSSPNHEPDLIDTSSGNPPGPATGSADPVRRAVNAIRPHEPVYLGRPSRPYMLPG